MLISLVTIPKILKKAAGSDTYKIIKVLEIEPGDKHRLTDGYTNNGYKLSVTYVDMPSFISTISTITGDYDVVYIGRANNDLPSLWNTDNNYRDYSAPFKQEWGTSLQGSYGCLSGEEVKYKDVTQSVWYGTMGLYEGANFNKLRYASKSGHITSTINGKTKTFSEYYPENDITNKKAKQILNMINSNQLVYIDNSIVTSNSLSTTKLVKNFKDCNKSNFKKVTLLDNNTLINDYTKTDSLSKRPDATLNEVPSGDTNENSNADESEILKNRYNLPSSFVGYLNFKIKVYTTDDEYVCNNLYGSAVFKNLTGEKQVINVLQVSPQAGTNIDLSSTDSNNLFYQNIKDLPDYSIKVTKKYLSDFNTMDSDTVLKDYDMIQLEFQF